MLLDFIWDHQMDFQVLEQLIKDTVKTYPVLYLATLP